MTTVSVAPDRAASIVILTYIELACGAALAGLALPGYGVTMLIWLGFMPLFWRVWHAVKGQRRLSREWPPLFFAGACAFAAYALVAQAWLLDLHPLTWYGLSALQSLLITWLAYGLNTLLWGLLGGVYALALLFLGRSVKKGWLLVACAPLVWMLLLGLWKQLPFAVPWAVPELALMNSPYLRQWPGFGGGLLWGGLILAVNLAGSGLFMAWLGARQRYRWAMVAGIFVFAALVVASHAPEAKTGQGPSQQASTALGLPMSLAVLQGNCSIEAIRSPGSKEKAACASWYFTQAKRLSTTHTILIMPEEGPLTGPIRLNAKGTLLRPEEGPLKRWQTLADTTSSYFVFGATAWKPEDRQLAVVNALLAVQPKSKPQLYKKQRLVPFGEALPDWSMSVFRALALPVPIPYRAGSDRQPLWSFSALEPSKKPLRIGPLVCFELLHADIAAGYKQRGADVLLNSSNLGWFHGNSVMQAQFLAFGQLRAVETGLPVLIAANTGNSASIEGVTGRIHQQLQANKAGWLSEN